jgi:ubiquinone/menaquinone biosynthesis C-methylase UbiE
MSLTAKEVEAVLKEQIANSRQALVETGYSEVPVRARLARRYGGQALDVGTGACACMAVALARRGLRVTAIDHASSAVRIAQERAAGKLSDTLEVRLADGSHLPFPDKSYRVAVAFDMLCHASNPAAILREMFRVSSGVVVISELNSAGRRVTHHHDQGFDARLPDLLAEHCQDCQRFDDAHHVTYVCERS